MQIFLENEEQTRRLGKHLARILGRMGPCPVLLKGPLGSGKTTLVRGLVEHMPGGENAEVSSPSFNLVNVYPTDPETVHIDLYRTGNTGLDASLDEYLTPAESLIIVEWSEFLPQESRPADSLTIHLKYSQKARQALISGQGKQAGKIADELSGLSLRTKDPETQTG
ncbi:MAG: tRNA (adenosine(37)-N6)-threonylcarbamoyltransferase complex ATPase subunit type 1 TsaE [Desulfohalobiaceae bacterium]|nr:tRNA (adenosine(37)-N6)-threonylcarbamoyltransferase complex ATPase subunit type 1 TsaE [Desulfohalobiaceae bacterium]